MREKPILFTSDMVKAYDEDRKTCTRRIIKPQPIGFQIVNGKFTDYNRPLKTTKDFKANIIKPPYKKGDHFYIKQNFWLTFKDRYKKTVYGIREDDSRIHDVKLTDREWAKFIKWKQPYAKKSKLFMFKSLAYKWAEVTNVRVERLQDINYDDILKEGLQSKIKIGAGPQYTILKQWIDLWNSINAKRGVPWESNPYVWVIEFRKIKHG